MDDMLKRIKDELLAGTDAAESHESALRMQEIANALAPLRVNADELLKFLGIFTIRAIHQKFPEVPLQPFAEATARTFYRNMQSAILACEVADALTPEEIDKALNTMKGH